MGFTKPVAHVHQYTAQEVFSLPIFLVEKWEGKAYRLVIQRQKQIDGELDLWEGEYTYRCILTNDHKSSEREVVILRIASSRMVG